MPMWAAVAVVAAAYVLRSMLRGWDFRPDMPIDAILLFTFAALVVLRWTLGRSTPPKQGDGQGPSEMDGEDGRGGEPRDDDQL